jgi:hypothetical protein
VNLKIDFYKFSVKFLMTIINLPVILSLGLCSGIEVVRRNSSGGLARGSSISDISRASVAPGGNPIRELNESKIIN